MSDTHHLDKGIGVAKQYTIAVLERVAEAIAKNPSFQHLVRAVDPTHGVGAAQVIRLVTGYFDFPGDTVLVEFLNDVFDDFAGNLATLIEKHAHDPAAMALALKPVVDKAIEDALKQPVRLIGSGVHYVPTACVHFPRPWTQRGQEAPKDLERGAAIKMGTRPGCTFCYPAMLRDGNAAEEKREQKDEAPKPATGKSLFDSYLELKGKKPFLAEEFWSAYLKADDLVKHKLTTVFSRQGSADLIESFAVIPSEQWNDAVNAMLGNQNEAVEKFSHHVMRKLGEWGNKVSDRLDAEGEEEKRTIDKIGGIIRDANAKLDARLNPLVLVPDAAPESNTMKFAALTAGFVLVVVAIVYAAHMLG